MIIKQTNLNVVYPRISDYRKKFVLAEDVLQEHFMAPTILPVPDQVQEDVPRIIVQTKNGHSVLNIALSVASFTTNYDGAYAGDWEHCKAYLDARCASVYGITENLTGNRNIFVGLITNVEIDDLSENGLVTLKKSLLGTNAGKLGEPYDLSCKLTYVYKERFFINIVLENAREFEVQQFENGKTCVMKERRHTVSACIDVNDRYIANKSPEYVSDKNVFNEILEITSNIINNKLKDLVEKGEFSYDD